MVADIYRCKSTSSATADVSSFNIVHICMMFIYRETVFEMQRYSFMRNKLTGMLQKTPYNSIEYQKELGSSPTTGPLRHF